MNNHHATLIAIDRKGVLIQGPSGSGKTLLALHLYKRCHLGNVPVEIIADDQVLLAEKMSRMIGQAPTALKHQIEVRGLGIVDLPPLERADIAICLHVSLVEQEELLRFWDEAYFEVDGVLIKSLILSIAQLEAAGNAVLAALGVPLHI